MFFYKSLGNSFLILGEGVDVEDGDCRARYTRSQRQLRDGDCHTRSQRQLQGGSVDVEDGDCRARYTRSQRQLQGSDVDKGKHLPTTSRCEEALATWQSPASSIWVQQLLNCRCEEAQPTWQSPASSIWVKKQCEKYPAHGLITYKQDKSESKSEHKFSAKVFNSDGSDGQFSGNGMRCLAHHIFCENKDLCKILIKMGNNKNYHKALKEKGGIYKNRVITYHKLQNTDRRHCETLSKQSRVKCEARNTYRFAKIDKLKLFSYIDFKKAIIPMDAIGVFINVGNPHILINSVKHKSEFLEYIEDLQTKDLSFLDFNISQYKKISKNKYELLTVERGVGPTPACSSAALALCNYLNSLGEFDSETIEIIMPGGCLKVELMGDKVKFCAGVDVE
jgi:diaminopimelate epimerase